MIWPIILVAVQQVWKFLFGAKPTASNSSEAKTACDGCAGQTGDKSKTPEGEAATGGAEAATDGGTADGGVATDLAAAMVAGSIDRQAYPTAIDITTSTHWETVISTKTPVFARFSAPWCKPCHAIIPLFNELCNAHSEAAEFVVLNVDELDEVAVALQVFSLPTIVCLVDGQETGRIAGKEENKIRAFVQEALEKMV